MTGRTVTSAHPLGAPAEHRELVSSRSGLGLFVAGAWRSPSVMYEDFSPTDGSLLAHIAEATDEDVDAAVGAASRAQVDWARLPALERGRFVREVAQRIRGRLEDLAALDALDGGNPISACRFDVRNAVEVLEYMAGLALEVKGETIPTSLGILDMTLREPFGVAARITAFNHPTLFASKALGAPLVAGNTVIIKPSPWTPLSSTLLVEIAAEVLPPGVVNLVTGGVQPAIALAHHPLVRRLNLTGSVEAGLAISRAAAERAVKVVTLELGGKNPLIAMPDADPLHVADAVVDGMNLKSSAGQSCGSTSRLIVHSSLRERVVQAAAASMEAMRLGHPLAAATEMGPLVSEAQRQKTERYVAGAQAAGARLVCGGGRPEGAAFEGGFFYRPTLFDNISADMAIAREEVFGPVLIVQPWDDLEAAIDVANSTRYGLTASVFTNNLSAAMILSRRLQAGYVWINGVSHHQLGAPFGGYRDSGTAREDSLGELLSYTQLKNVNVGVPS